MQTKLIPGNITNTELASLQRESYADRMSLCMDCKNSCGNCTWSSKYKPVNGWKASKTIIQDSHRNIPSYKVEECPCYCADRPHKQGYKITNEAVNALCGIKFRIERHSVQHINKRLHQNYPELDLVWYSDPCEEFGSFYIKLKNVKSNV